MSGGNPPADAGAVHDAAERELVAAVAAALATVSLPKPGARPATRARRSAWRLAGRRRVLQQWVWLAEYNIHRRRR
jgi:hypothetical protein